MNLMKSVETHRLLRIHHSMVHKVQLKVEVEVDKDREHMGCVDPGHFYDEDAEYCGTERGDTEDS